MGQFSTGRRPTGQWGELETGPTTGTTTMIISTIGSTIAISSRSASVVASTITRTTPAGLRSRPTMAGSGFTFAATTTVTDLAFFLSVLARISKREGKAVGSRVADGFALIQSTPRRREAARVTHL